MKDKIYYYLILLLTSAIVFTSFSNTGTIHVVITGIRTNQGKVGLEVFDNEKAFPVDPSKAIRKVRLSIKNNMCDTSFTGLPYGTYAVACYHDENNDGKLNFGFLKIPKEGTCASNNAKGH